MLASYYKSGAILTSAHTAAMLGGYGLLYLALWPGLVNDFSSRHLVTNTHTRQLAEKQDGSVACFFSSSTMEEDLGQRARAVSSSSYHRVLYSEIFLGQHATS